MPPFKGDGSGSQRITSFFRRFTIPRARWTDPNHIEDEIVVATPSTASDAYSGGSQKQASSASESSQDKQLTPLKRERPRKSPGNSSSPSSSASTPKRGRGRPHKHSQSSPVAAPSSKRTNVKSSTLQQSSATFNINPVTGEADGAPTKDSPYRDPSASPSSKRVALGVEMTNSEPASPGASPSDDMAAPAPTATTSAAPPIHAQPAMAASFSSTSTLSSVPLSSHPTTTSAPISTSSSSKRIIKDGLKAVTGSDSELDEDSDDELMDPAAFLLPKKKTEPEPPSSRLVKSTEQMHNPFTASRRPVEHSLKRKASHTSITFLPKKVFRKSLAQMAAEHQRRELADAKIARMELDVREAERQEEVSQQQEEAGVEQDGDEVMVVAESDSDHIKGERGRLAMRRTEAMQRKNQYYFFLDDQPVFENTPFPVDALPEAPWSRLYADEQSRKQACKSGFAAELAAIHPLPVTVTNWLTHQLNYEQDGVLCEAYIQILETCSQHQESVSNTIASISSMYKTRSSFEHNWTEQLRRGLPSGLKNILRVVSFCAPAADDVVSDASPSMTAAAFLDLAMINIDELVHKDINLSLEVGSCVENMLEALPQESFENLIPEVIGILFLPGDLSPTIRCRLIASLPSGTLRAYRIRRRLALECFSTVINRKSIKEQNWPNSILKSLRTKPELQITADTDYDLLEAYIDVLEIAVAAGFTPYPELTISRTQSGGILATNRPICTAAGKQHDEQVDTLIKRLNYLTSRIRGGGTTHMRLTEVKTQIEKFLARLANSVRTTPPVKRGIFDGDDGMEQSTLVFGGSVARDKEASGKAFKSARPIKKEECTADIRPPPAQDDGATDDGINSL